MKQNTPPDLSPLVNKKDAPNEPRKEGRKTNGKRRKEGKERKKKEAVGHITNTNPPKKNG